MRKILLLLALFAFSLVLWSQELEQESLSPEQTESILNNSILSLQDTIVLVQSWNQQIEDLNKQIQDLKLQKQNMEKLGISETLAYNELLTKLTIYQARVTELQDKVSTLLKNYKGLLKVSEKYRLAYKESEKWNKILATGLGILVVAIIIESVIIANKK